MTDLQFDDFNMHKVSAAKVYLREALKELDAMSSHGSDHRDPLRYDAALTRIESAKVKLINADCRKEPSK